MPAEPWAPIPPHAVKIGESWALPERLTEVDGKPYVRCALHGLIPADHRCGDSPHDHYCIVSAHPNHPEGEPHDDQGTAHNDWANVQADKISAIRSLHQKDEGPGGMTSGACAECGIEWPCPTVHIANGWGEIYDCWDEGFCRHAGVTVTDPMPDLLAVLQDEDVSDFEGDDDA